MVQGTQGTYAVDLGFCIDIEYVKKRQEALQQHQQLMEWFRAGGVAELHLHSLLLGSTGCRFHFTVYHLKQVGVSQKVVTKVLEEVFEQHE